MREAGKTIIIIAHRLSTIMNADKIVVVEKGKVAEEGSHSQLLQNRKAYYQLWASQFVVEDAALVSNPTHLYTLSANGILSHYCD